MHGVIARLVPARGFGFIQAFDGTDYFFPRIACVNAPFDDLRVGQAVMFDEEASGKGPRAMNVIADAHVRGSRKTLIGPSRSDANDPIDHVGASGPGPVHSSGR